MILCSDNTLYTGVTIDMENRFAQHACQRGAKYFRGRDPESVVYLESGHDRSSASQREAFIKQLRRTEKEQLIASSSNEIQPA